MGHESVASISIPTGSCIEIDSVVAEADFVWIIPVQNAGWSVKFFILHFIRSLVYVR